MKPKMRRTLSGKFVPEDYVGLTPPTEWKFAKVGKGLSRNPFHPSRKHDVARPEPVPYIPAPIHPLLVDLRLRRRTRRRLDRVFGPSAWIESKNEVKVE